MSETPPPQSGLIPLLGPPSEDMINCNQKLKELGIENTIQLPEICVIGDQSAGKSSLIQALSEIKVPRAAGCCTQCPLQINLSGGEGIMSPWKRIISLIDQYDYNAGTTSKKPTSRLPLGPWIERREIEISQHHFYTTNNKDDVCGLISRAQLAILNPSTDYSLYLPGQDTEVDDTFDYVHFDWLV